MKKAIVITTLGEVTIIDLTEGSLEKLQKAVGGYVQGINLSEGVTMWCNENGKMMRLPHNPFGQAFWETAHGHTDYIVGDIVLTGSADDEGDMLGFTIEEIDEIVKVIKTCWSSSELMQPKITIH